MSVARTGALPNAYKFFTIAVNRFEQKQMEGFVGHESQTGAAPFHNLAQMVHIFNYVFGQIHYPMSTVDQRQFNRKNLQAPADAPIEFTGPAECSLMKGSLATFRVHVKYRYHATWQGIITWLEGQATYPFESFIQLMKVFDRILGDESPKAAPLGKHMCEVSVRDYRNFVLSGDVSHPAVEERMQFANEFGLMEQMDAMFGELGQPAQETVIFPRKPVTYKGSLGSLTFVVRLLFNSNCTWQGTIRWKERGEQESFRSFLEMLMMMDQAARRVIGTEAGASGKAAEPAS